jgi:hypothetical protein
MVLSTLLGEAVDRDLNPSEFKKRWRRGEFWSRGAMDDWFRMVVEQSGCGRCGAATTVMMKSFPINDKNHIIQRAHGYQRLIS